MGEPKDPDEPFVVHCSFDYDNNKFGVLVSTRRLLDNAKHSKGIQCDATYKLAWDGFPILIAGVSDLDRVFHSVGISITSGEAREDFQFLFTGIEQLQMEGFGPQILLSDAAEAVTHGFLNVFGDTFTRAYCFFHDVKNADDKRTLVKDNGIWKKVRNDISKLQLARSSEEFEAKKELCNRKYKKNPSTRDFQKYFHEEHLK
jgi:hypothetical protein